MLIEIPERIEAERIYLRKYHTGDGRWYYVMSQKNREHLARYETENPARSLRSEQDAEVLMRQFSAEWVARNCFFLGAFKKVTDEFVCQVYIGPVNWDLPEFEIGFFVDKDHEGQGYVTEAVKAALGLVFKYMNAHRVRMECDDTNARSWKVAERCGMTREAQIRENKKGWDGTFTGTLLYGLLDREFK